MDKHIIELLMSENYITTIGVNPDDYKTVEDLIKGGIVTIPGAYDKINALLDKVNIKLDDTNKDIVKDNPVIEVLLDDKPIVDEPITDLNIIDETPVSEPVIDETPVSEPVIDETPEEEVPTIVEDVKEKKSVKKSTKRTE